MPRSATTTSKTSHVSSPPIRPPPIMGPIMTPSATPSFAQNVKDGFSVGVGVSVARNLVDRMFGSSQPTVVPSKQQSCKDLIASYEVCVLERSPSECQPLWTQIKECMK